MAAASAVVAPAVLMVAAMLVVIRVGNICNTKRIMTNDNAETSLSKVCIKMICRQWPIDFQNRTGCSTCTWHSFPSARRGTITAWDL